jgi:isocitrate/isopropylmalate dehydrogenase
VQFCKEEWAWQHPVTSVTNMHSSNPFTAQHPSTQASTRSTQFASINSIQMMMDYLGRKNGEDELIEVARLIDDSVADHLREGKLVTYDIGGSASCSDVGTAIADRLAHKLSERF